MTVIPKWSLGKILIKILIMLLIGIFITVILVAAAIYVGLVTESWTAFYAVYGFLIIVMLLLGIYFLRKEQKQQGFKI